MKSHSTMNFLLVSICSLLRAANAQRSVLNSNDSSIWLNLLEAAFHTADVSNASNVTIDSKNVTVSDPLLDLLPSTSVTILHNVSTVNVDESKLTFMDYGGHTFSKAVRRRLVYCRTTMGGLHMASGLSKVLLTTSCLTR